MPRDTGRIRRSVVDHLTSATEARRFSQPDNDAKLHDRFPEVLRNSRLLVVLQDTMSLCIPAMFRHRIAVSGDHMGCGALVAPMDPGDPTHVSRRPRRPLRPQMFQRRDGRQLHDFWRAHVPSTLVGGAQERKPLIDRSAAMRGSLTRGDVTVGLVVSAASWPLVVGHMCPGDYFQPPTLESLMLTAVVATSSWPLVAGRLPVTAYAWPLSTRGRLLLAASLGQVVLVAYS